MPSEIGDPPQKNTILKLKSLKPSQPVSQAQPLAKAAQPRTHEVKQPTEVVTQSLNSHASQLNTLLDGILQSAQTLEQAQTRISDIKDLLNNIQNSLSDEGLQPTIKSEKYFEFTSKINEISTKTSSSVNLLKNDTLDTVLSDTTQKKLTTTGTDLSAQGLGLPPPLSGENNDIVQIQDDVKNALQHVYNFRTQLNNDLSIISDQKNFTQSTINTIENGAKTLNTSDRSDESANLIALQTRQILSNSGNIPLAARSQQNVLRLF